MEVFLFRTFSLPNPFSKFIKEGTYKNIVMGIE